MMLTETNVHAQVDDLTLSGFHEIMRIDQNGRQGGCVVMYVAENVDFGPCSRIVWILQSSLHVIIFLLGMLMLL